MFACVAYCHISLNVSWSTIDQGESVAQTNLVMTSFVSSAFRPLNTLFFDFWTSMRPSAFSAIKFCLLGFSFSFKASWIRECARL